MPLTTVNMVPGGHLMSVDIKQYADLLTGVMADQPVTINNRLSLTGPIQQVEVATPAAPPSGNMRLYPKVDGNYYKLDPAGVETPLGAGADEIWVDPNAPVPRLDYDLWIDTDSPDPAPGPLPTTWIFTQGPPSAAWTINHDLGCYPSVTVVDTGDSVIIPSVQYNTANTLTCIFGSPTSGKAYLN